VYTRCGLQCSAPLCSIAHVSEHLIRELFRTIDARRWTELPAFFDPEIHYERPGYAPIDGLAALLDFYANVRIVACGEHVLSGITAHETRAACWGVFRGVSVTGKALEERFADIYSIRAGRVVTRTTYFYRAAI